MKKIFVIALLLLASACDSAEDRAKEHLSSAVEYVEAGDPDRAVIELRNALKLDPKNHDALLMMAEIQKERGNVQGAFNNYRRLVEAFPEDPAGNRELALIAFQANQFTDAERYLDKAEELTPGDSELAAIRTALAYRQATLDKSDEAMGAAGRDAAELLASDDSLDVARRVVIADLLRQQRFGAALETIDAGLARNETDRDLYAIRFSVLSQLGDKGGIEDQLKRMVVLFPEDDDVGATLVRWYISEKRIDEAEAWLRDRIDPAADNPEPRLTLVRFLSELRGPQPALEELETTLAMDPQPADVAADPATFRALHAGFLFSTGKTQEAIAEMQDLVDAQGTETPEGEALDRLNRYKVSLAQMQGAVGNQVAARALVEEVLAADASDVSALKLKASWQVIDDQTAEAIVNLRSALSEAPRDAEIMTLLSAAYEREGNRELMAEMLSLAVEASNRAPQTSIRYANFLAQQEKYRAAEEVLINSLRLAPQDLGLLSTLGRVHLAMEDWARAEQDIERLRQLDDPRATALADEMQAQLLARQRKTDDLTSFLEQLGQGDVNSDAAVIRANLLSGRTEEALSQSQALIEANPEDPAARFIRALVLTITGDFDEGIPMLEETVQDAPQAEQAWSALFNAYRRTDQPEEASNALDRALEANPGSLNLQWIKAGELEAAGDIDGAIGIYEKLYEQNSTLVVVANNLASLLSSYRDDPESIDRAYTVARRLKGNNTPAFQDTYGWIAFRKGDAQEALAPMEAAAEGLPGDPTVRYHLAEVYAALGRTEEARSAYETAMQLLEDANTQPPGLASRISDGLKALPAPGTAETGTTE
ncbi:tetratricopeptide repeat protein [Pseudooceanicola nitratireducens]|uniref:tetratricopeptide repeat protein n=1 Tax=Pseudooceanicola nitratireducens TaxID=517719 RepID=UPI003C7B9A4F